jgi:uncharacterized protein (TIGR00106 family)
MIVADFSLIPMGSETSAGKYIKAVYEMLQDSGVTFLPGPMTTSVETKSFEELFDIIRRANEKLVEMDVERIITTVRIDYRLDKEISISSKLEASRVK